MNSQIIFWLLSLLITFNLSSCKEKTKHLPKNSSNKLQDYIRDRKNFSYKLEDSIRIDRAIIYRFKMNSGKWLTNEEVNEPLWWHWLDIVVPDIIDTQTALLFIGPGSKEDSKKYLDNLSIQKAIENKSIVSHVSNIPFQPLRFIDSDSIARYEDNLISYGWNQFLTNGALEKDVEWLARFPMTRAVVRAMDVVQEFTMSEKHAVKDFFYFRCFKARMDDLDNSCS